MITIHISSPRGEGATSAAIVIARMLRGFGCRVTYRTYSAAAADQIEKEIQSGESIPFQPRNFEIRDGIPE